MFVMLYFYRRPNDDDFQRWRAQRAMSYERLVLCGSYEIWSWSALAHVWNARVHCCIVGYTRWRRNAVIETHRYCQSQHWNAHERAAPSAGSDTNDVGDGGQFLDTSGLATDKNILECGPMPNLMVALPNICGALCSTPKVWLTPNTRWLAVTLPRRESRWN